MKPTIDERLAWLREGKYLTTDDESTNLPVTASLTMRTVDRIFRDAPDETLLELNRYVQKSLRQRGRLVKVALSTYNACFDDRCVTDQLRCEAYKPFVAKFLTDSRPGWDVNDEVIQLLSRYLTIYPHENAISKVAHIVDCMTADVESTLDELEDIQGNEGMLDYDEFFSMDVDDPYFVAAVERLIARGEPPEDILLITINVPLGKKIKQHFSMQCGDYVELVDE